MKLSLHQTRLLRLRAQRLSPISPPESQNNPASVLETVTGLQAQELAAARLGLRARSSGLTDAGIRQALDTPGELAHIWAMRGTLHLFSAADAAWLVPLLGPIFLAAGKRRFRELGWDDSTAGRGFALLRAALEARYSLTRPEIIQMLAQAGLPSEGQAPFHLIDRAALSGWLCAGPARDGEATYTLFEDWVGPLQPLPRPEALKRLARRYMAGYAPAGPDDLAKWSGLKAGDVRLGWEQIAGELLQVETAGQPAWLLPGQLTGLDEPTEPVPLVRLLPRFDAYLLGYASRDLAVDPVHARQVHPGGGIIRAVLLVDGQARGTWQMKARKTGLQVAVEPFEVIPDEWLPSLEAEVADLGRFLGREAQLILL